MSNPSYTDEYNTARLNKAVELFKSLPDDMQIEIMDEWAAKTNLGSLDEILANEDRLEQEGELQFDPDDSAYPNK